MIVPTSPSRESVPGEFTVLDPGPSDRVARFLPGPLRRPLQRWAAKRRARSTHPEAVHALGQSMARVGAKVARRADAPLILDRAPDDGRVPQGARALRRERRYLRACAAILTASENDALQLSNRHGLAARPLVCRDITEPPAFSPTAANLRRRLQLRDEPVVLMHGTEPTDAQASGLVQALAACPDIHLVVLGADRWRSADTIQLEVERQRCASRFHLLRDVPLKRIPAYADDADVGLCLPSPSRPRALLDSVYRYAHAGMAVIVPPASEGELIVGRFEFGWIAEPADPEQLGAVLEQACGPERGTRRKAARRAGRTLTWKAEAQVVIGLYQRLQGSDQPVLAPNSSRIVQAPRYAAALARDFRARRAQGLRTNPRAFAHHVWGRHLRDRGEYGRSVAHFERALHHSPQDTAAALQHAASLKDAGRSQEAIEAYKKLLAAQEGKPNTAAVNAAINLVRLGVRQEPRVVLERLTKNAKAPGQFARAAELAVALGDVAAASAAIEHAVGLAPEDSSLARVRARVLEQAGEPERALESARRCSDPAAVARLEGLLLVYDPTWRPDSPPKRRLKPVEGRVQHLLETSLPHATSGYSYRTRTVLAAQRNAGLEPVAATRLGFPANRGIHEFAHTEVLEGVVHHRFTLPGVRRYTSVPMDQQLQKNVQMLGRLVETVRPQVLHAATPHHNGLLGLSLRESTGIPLIYEVRGFPEMTWAVRAGGESASVYELRRRAETRCMMEADAVVTLSGVMKDHIVSRGVPADRVWVVPHMIDIEAIAPTPRSPELVQRYGLEGKVVVGYLGTLVDYEGIDLLLRALAELASAHPALTGLIVGGGPAEPSLRALAKELGIDDRVVFAGRIPHGDVNRHVALFDLYVLPRHDHEVCRWVTPLKPYEAMASGRCVLTSDVEALAETVADGCGVTFRAGDVTALAAAIAELAEDPERRDELGSRGREKMVSAHDESVLASVAALPVRAACERLASAS